MGKRTERRLGSIRRATVRRRLLIEPLGDRRVLATITGAVFEDANFSLQRDPGEALLPSRLIYIDANDNAAFDQGERFVVAEEDGTYAFPDLGDGTFVLRLYNGTDSQQQTTPVDATVSENIVSTSGTQVLVTSDATVVLDGGSIVLGDLDSGQGQSLSVATELTKLQELPDGRVLVIGEDGGGNTAWIVDPEAASVTPIDLAGSGQPVPWSDVAVDGQGYGLLIEQANDDATIYSLDATSSAQGIQVSATATTVPADTQVLTSINGTRSVFASAVSDGMQVSLWSNSSAALITTNPVDLTGTQQMLAFDDASGLLVMRTSDGGVSVHDVNQNFATLHSLPDVTGPVAIDGVRDLLMTISPVDAMLRLIDMRDGALIADLAIDLSSIGAVAALATGDRPDAIVILGAAGVTEVALNKAGANRIHITGGQDIDSVLFGVALNGGNAAPDYDSFPELKTNEDTTLSEAAPATLVGSSDADGDEYVLLQLGPPANGTGELSIDGEIVYTPNPDFFGTDTVPVVLHDGRSVSDLISLPIQVMPTPDPPDIDVGDMGPIPEDLPHGEPVADVEIVDVDLQNDHLVFIEDFRFDLVNGKLIFVGGVLDFESEPDIEVKISITDLELDETFDRFVNLRISDVNEPVTDIELIGQIVSENDPGAEIGVVTVLDEDRGQDHQFSVDDDRFEIDDENKLRLKPDVSLDFETEPDIVINITANDGAGSSLTEEFTLTVFGIIEQPGTVELSNETVMELELGAVVGEVLIDGGPPDERFNLSVDDGRFEIVEATLKLRDDTFVEKATQDEIQLKITVTDPEDEFETISGTFIIDVLENETPYHNDENPYDVDHSGEVKTLDALIVINYLNTHGPGPVGEGSIQYCYDVNGDGMVTALDALLILNEITRRNNADDIVGAEPEQAPDAGEDDDAKGGGQAQADQGREGIFNNWAGEGESVAGAGQASQADPDPTVLPSPRQTKRSDFAASVDQTLKLLSDE